MKQQKQTCRRCQRTVVVIEIDGQRVEADPEYLNVIPIDGPPAFVTARRAHADLCQRYQIDAEKAKARNEASGKRKSSFGGGVGQRPKNGRSEPGQ